MRCLTFVPSFIAVWACFLLPTSFVPAQAGGKVDVTGTWKAEFDTQIGLQKYTFTLKQDGTAISGKASVDTNGEKRDVTFKEGKIDGDKLTLIELLAIQGKDVRVTFTGKASVDQIKFTRQVGDLGSSEATAKRVASDPAKPAPGKGAGKDGKGGFGGPIKLGPDDKPAFPDAPAGFNAARDKVPHGDVKVVEYDSKTLGTRRRLAFIRPPAMRRTASTQCSICYMAWETPAQNGRNGPKRLSSSTTYWLRERFSR